jgi:Sec-independent protein translocase protein TatA
MDDFEDAARDIGQGIRNLRDLIDAERQRQTGANENSLSETESRERRRERR